MAFKNVAEARIAIIPKHLIELEDWSEKRFWRIEPFRLYANSEYLLFANNGLASAVSFKCFQTQSRLIRALKKRGWYSKYGYENIKQISIAKAREIVATNVRLSRQDYPYHKELREQISSWREDGLQLNGTDISLVWELEELLCLAINNGTDFETPWLHTKQSTVAIKITRLQDICTVRSRDDSKNLITSEQLLIVPSRFCPLRLNSIRSSLATSVRMSR